ncbi:MAG TPA: ribbon-helix-helix domain-containing protein [Chloroflexota bacterium]|nr:ribbon-helix-helix domain-containing protein [Chloroflexota bacterium]
MKSLRLDEKLAQRLDVTAKRLGWSESEVMRWALDQYLDPAPGESVLEAWAGYIGAIDDGPEGDFSSNAGRHFAEHLREKYPETWRELRVAETKAGE